MWRRDERGYLGEWDVTGAHGRQDVHPAGLPAEDVARL